MAGNAYDILTVDLTVAGNRRQLVQRDAGITSITVLVMPPAATFALHVGQQEAIPVPVAGFVLDEICPPANDGLFATYPAQPGISVILYVGFGGPRAGLV